MLVANGASIPTIAGTVEEEEEYARSEANSAHYDGYVTDHTDLASEIDIDESEYRRELLNDKWRMLFDKFDPEGFGEIPVEDFLAALKSPEWKIEIPPNKRDILLTRAKESRVEAVTFQDFVNVGIVIRAIEARANKSHLLSARSATKQTACQLWSDFGPARHNLDRQGGQRRLVSTTPTVVKLHDEEAP